MALVIPCVPDITIHVSQPEAVSRCCCPCPVSGVTTTAASARGHACVPLPTLLPTLGGPHAAPQSCSGDVSPHLGGLRWEHPGAMGGCTGSTPVLWGAAPSGAAPWGCPGSCGAGARLCCRHGARNGRSNSCDLLISPLRRVPSPHSSCRQFRGALPVSLAGTHPDKPGCPRPTWGRRPWRPVGAVPDSGWAAHVRHSGISMDPGCIRGASLETPPRVGLRFPSGGLPHPPTLGEAEPGVARCMSGPPGCPWIWDESGMLPCGSHSSGAAVSHRGVSPSSAGRG